jgi:23S rRNA (adenine2030-N6)-methyltransferase
MNYKHIYHAGNHTEVFKHSVLSMLLGHLRQKPAPFAVLDTHAGLGRYDLKSTQAEKTGEWRNGIAQVIGTKVPTASLYFDLVTSLNPNGLRLYPGSPTIVQSLLRSNDRLVACDLDVGAASQLRRQFRGDERVSVHQRDGYEAVRALLPLKAARGLVFIDPPFESDREPINLASALETSARKWPNASAVAWYPIKSRRISRYLKRICNYPEKNLLCCEFLIKPPNNKELVGSGLLISNAPWQFEVKLGQLCHELALAFKVPRPYHSLGWLRRPDG